MLKKILFIFFVIFLSTVSLEAGSLKSKTTEEKEEEFDIVSMIMEHITDANEWHLWTTVDSDGHKHHHVIPLPIIIWDGNFHMFLSSRLSHGEEYDGYVFKKGVLYSTCGKKKATFIDLFKGLENKYIDLSITKNALAMFFSVILLIVIFITMAKSYKKNNLKPRGIAAFLEPVVIFVRDEIAIPNIGKNKYEKFLPFLLTIFFFIWFNNLLGLLPTFPGGANVTGNIAITFVLALIIAIVVNFNGNKHYWKEIFLPNVPLWLYPIMVPVEMIGVITKPFALMIRLFANITAGHIVVLSLLGMIFIFKSLFVSLGAIPMTLFVLCLEVLVAVLQAYIFTVLSALFIGLAVKEHE